MNKRLTHVYPYYAPPEDDPNAPVEEWRQVWEGHLRIVRNRRRAKLLRKRGVRMMQEMGCWLWFVKES